MGDDFAIRLQARMQRATLDEPRVGSLPAAFAGLAIAMGALLAISWAQGNAGECIHLLARLMEATATVIEGG